MRLYITIFIYILGVMSFVASFSWKSCGKITAPLKVTTLDAYSNKTRILYVTGRGKSAINITAPIKADILMQKKFFWGWTTIPCVDQMGSCIYDDICSLDQYFNGTCPTEFIENDIPCKCPILQRQYAVKRFPIYLDAFPLWVEEGTYRVKLRLSKEEEELFCILMHMSF